MIKKIYVILTLLSIQTVLASVCPQQLPNHLQPAPVLFSATNVDGVITVTGRLVTARRNTSYLIQFFGNPANRNPITEGADYIDEITVTTDCFGAVNFTATLRLTRIEDPFLSATATLILCDGTLSDTSRFSLNTPITFLGSL